MDHLCQVEIPSDDEEEEVITITEETYKPMSLEKMVTLIAILVEKSRGENNQLHISDKDYSAIIGGKGFPFLFNQIRDSINVRQTCNLLFSLSRWNEQLAIAVCTFDILYYSTDFAVRDRTIVLAIHFCSFDV